MSIVCRTMTRFSGKNTPRDSSWTNGDSSTTWRGTRPTGPISVSPLCGSIMASTRVWERETPGPPSTIRLPHIKGTTPDRDATPTESELAGSDHGDSGQEEGEVTQAERNEPGSFTQMKSRDTDSGSEDTTPGRDLWRSARGRETVMLTTPRTRGRGKRRMERGGGSTKRPRMESSAARDLRNLPLSAKTDRRTAHSRSVSGDEHGRGPSRSSRSSSDHGRSGQGPRSRSREPTLPQLMNFSIDDFTVVLQTMDSFTFTSAHHFFPGWVRVVGAHRNDRVRGTPCAHNPEEELRAKRRVRRDVEPPEVRRFLRKELLRKVGHSWWNRPRVYRHDLADERESTPSVRSVVVIPSDPEQPEVSPEQQEPGPSGSSDRMTLVGPVASPITSLIYPHSGPG